MPRPPKCRKVCQMPACTEFGPVNNQDNQIVIMTLDEYEAIRLIDLEDFTQEQCAEQMEIARTTVQSIYASARKKLAKCIIDGFQLSIAGGNVTFCNNCNNACNSGCCRKKHLI